MGNLDTSAWMNFVPGRDDKDDTPQARHFYGLNAFEVVFLHGERLRHKTFENSPAGYHPVTAWLMPQGIRQAPAGVEATGTYGEDLALDLYQADRRVSEVNPAHFNASGQRELQRNENDRIDATSIAHFAVTQAPDT